MKYTRWLRSLWNQQGLVDNSRNTMITTVPPGSEKAGQFLERARPWAGQNKFALGTFERGITLFRQQLRALNLIYAFVEARTADGQRLIEEKARIAVVGGGAFGVTAAAAAAYAGFETTLFERQQELMHLQRGCDTRWVH